MADNLCGPSNALQNFQKHSTVDRTLQQDRLISRPSPSTGFRSLQGPNTGHLDPEFEVFQNGQLSYGGQLGQQQLSHPSTPFQPQLSHPPTPQTQPQLALSGWASDFQRLHVSTPSPSPFQQPNLQNRVQQRQDVRGWHQDFAQQFQNGQNSSVMQPGHIGNQAYGNQYSLSPPGIGVGAQYYGGVIMGQAEQLQQPTETFDDAAFARAFEMASRAELEAEAEAARLREEEESLIAEFRQDQTGEEILLDKSAEQFMSSDGPQISDQAPIGADLIEDHKLQREAEDPDAMARTAAQVLDTVRNNSSDKFANSEFFSLMRQFRDKELRVAGDKIVNSNAEVTKGGEEINVGP